MTKETIQEINRLANKVRDLQAKLDHSMQALNFYKDQNAKLQTSIGQLESRMHIYRDSMPVLEAPQTQLPDLTKEDY